MSTASNTLAESIKRHTLDELREFYQTVIEDTCNTDTAIRESARRVLTEHEVEGDQYQVPSVEHIVELLVVKIEELHKHAPAP
jgi:predicted aconitase